MNPSPREAKSLLRQQLRSRRQQVHGSNHAAASTALCQIIMQSALWESARSVLAFVHREDEPDIMPLLQLALDSGKSLLLPRWNEAQARYDVAQVRCRSEDLEPGQFGIAEPLARCQVVEPVNIDLALVPGLAFSPYGERLGRGKGHFDGLLRGAIKATKMGTAFEEQLLEKIPTEPHDERVDWVAMPTRLLDCRS